VDVWREGNVDGEMERCVRKTKPRKRYKKEKWGEKGKEKNGEGGG